MKKSIFVLLLLATLVFTGGCVSTDDTPTYNPSQSGGAVIEEENLLLTKTFTSTTDGGVVTVTTNEITRTATATVEFSPANDFGDQFSFEVSSSMVVNMLKDPMALLNWITEMQQYGGGTIDPEVQSFWQTIAGYDMQSVTVSGYINGQYVSATYQN